MLRRLPVLALALSASFATSYPEEYDFRTPCVDSNAQLQDWDPNRPLYLKWYGDQRIPTGTNFHDSVIVEPVDGAPIDYWAVAVPGGAVHVCAKGGLEPDTEYEWRVRQFVNEDRNALPVPYFEHVGIVRFRTAASSAFDPIGSQGQCRRFSDWPFETLPACTYAYLDADGDGWGTEEDCDDTDPLVNPGAPERCNEIDDNCDGRIDEDFDQRVWLDADGDGFGDPGASIVVQCEGPPPDTVANGIDCDDTNPDINPAADDLSDNGIDEDCDGMDGTDFDTAGPQDTGGATGTTGDTGLTGETATTASTGHTG